MSGQRTRPKGGRPAASMGSPLWPVVLLTLTLGAGLTLLPPEAKVSCGTSDPR